MLSTKLRTDVSSLATAAGRKVGTPGHAMARGKLIERLDGLGLEPHGERFQLPYTVGRTDLCNLIAEAPGRDRSLEPIVLAAHYDTCGVQPGADDNAAAIAIVLEIAERLLREPTERGVIVALFDGEEPPNYLTPAMGSIHWYHHQRRTAVHCAIVLDLMGHDVPAPGIEDLVFVMGMETDPGLVMTDMAVEGIRIHPVLNQYVGDTSDHHVFRVNEDPFLFLSCGRWQHYHQVTDTPDVLNYAKMVSMTALVESLVRRVDETPLNGSFGAGETLALEIDAIHRHFGPILGPEKLPHDRDSVRRFINKAMNAFRL